MFSTLALADDVRLQLAVSLNGRPTGLVATLTQRDGALYAEPGELEQIGLLVPAGIARAADGLVALASLPGVSARLNQRQQALSLTASAEALRPTELGLDVRGGNVPVTPASPGFVVNYDLQGTRVSRTSSAAGLFDARVFGLFGLFTSTAATYTAPASGQGSFVLLDSAWTYADPDSLRRITVGDTVTSGLSWTRPIRIGGFQVNTDFGLQPGLVTYPLPTVTGQAALPSTADLLLNGVRQFSQPVGQGPFQIRQPPVVTGAGTIEMAVQDSLGRQTVTSLPFYVSADMLRPGLATWSGELGAARREYGYRGDDYAVGLGAASLRYGLADWLTVESHGEGMSGLAMGGAGALLRLGALGVLSANAGGSTGWRGRGLMYGVGFQRQAPRLSLGAAISEVSPGFRDVAAVTGAPAIRSTRKANVGLSLGQYGSLAAAYVSQRGRATAASTIAAPDQVGLVLLPIAPSFQVATLTYTNQISDRIALLATAFTSVAGTRSFGVDIGLSVTIGERSSAYGGLSRDGGTSGVAQVQQSADLPGEFGYQALDQEGGQRRRLGEADYVGSWGRASVGVDNGPGYSAGRAGLRGGIAVADGTLFATRWIDDAFAVAHSGAAPGVTVLSENRPIDRTDGNSRLLIPSLRGWDTNAIGLEPNDLPADVQNGPLRTLVRPPEKSGVVVRFDVRRSNAAVLVLTDGGGKPLPVGTVLRVNGGAETVVGYDGEAYLEGLHAANKLAATPAGKPACHASFAYAAKPGKIPRIGPVACR